MSIAALLTEAESVTEPREAASKWREIARLAMAQAADCEARYRQTVRLVIPGDIVQDLSPNVRIHYRERAARTRKWRTNCWMAWYAHGRPLFVPPVAVAIVVCRGRKVDDDNALSSCKAARDSLWGEGAMLPADDSRYIEDYAVWQETGAQWKERPQIEIRITGERQC